MVIEEFRNGDARAVGRRFAERGRLMPEGVTYHASWIDPVGLRCYQVMEAADAADLDPWLRAWSDLVEFQVIPVQTSSEFWTAAT